MAHQREEPGDDEEHLDEGPNESDLGGRGHSVDLAQCPYCHKVIAEMAERCHHCGNYISREQFRGRLPVWIWIGIIACLVVALLWAILVPHG